MTPAAAALAWLIPLPGKLPLDTMELKPSGRRSGGIVIGRNKDCDLQLPMGAEEVSRRHAEFVHQDGQWGMADLGSRWGTLVNGTRISPYRLVRLREGDLIGIHPWTLRFSVRGPSPSNSLAIEEDGNTTIIHTLAEQPGEPLRQDMLHLLLEASAAIQAARDETALAGVLTDIARRGTGLANAAVLRALDAEGNVDAILVDSAGQAKSGSAMHFSRSLLAAAARGAVAEFSGATQANLGQSIIQSNVRAAICAPLMLGATVAAYLYVDSRGGPGKELKTLRSNAAGFCQALARMGGGALANLRRVEIERQAARMASELNAAATAQRWILPRAAIRAGPLTCVGQTRPGGYLGGDFFDAQALAGGLLAVSLGDVSGHGAAASILMTATQGFLHASLGDHGELSRALVSLNAFIRPRCPPDKFVTLWTGVFDPRAMTLNYVDAGHGLALLLKTDGGVQMLNENGGPPIGVQADCQYMPASVVLSPGDRVLVISDGIIEQCGATESPGSRREQFGLDGVRAAIESTGSQDLLGLLFSALHGFAGGMNLSDDATGVLVY